MIRCIVVDDEPLAQQVLEEHIRSIPELTLVKTRSNALEAFDIMHKEKIDLIFLDIQMPSLSGIDFIRSLKEPPVVIFTTAYSEYAVESYELNAVDYLLKPVTFERLSASIRKLLKQHIDVEPEPDYSYFKVNGKMVKIRHTDIICAQSIKDYIIIKTPNTNYITHMTMKYLAELLPAKLFRRVHRSFIVGANHITTIGRNVIELGDLKVPVGESYKIDAASLRSGTIR
ncbi:LytTR family DNA-binding domain-containing protein [Daejeonella sp.]|uniref:LytR/AlgR family response regulator transcription factor n=1 Tax=Daejeonella sp. TaxID=2805397 RepID=UPI002730FD95|nr:response regulator transcription factor [Daejeonella sp.]MDP2415208.1 response regulator transcription factor [Daejeonella sp.]